jgi:hypothetical protein
MCFHTKQTTRACCRDGGLTTSVQGVCSSCPAAHLALEHELLEQCWVVCAHIQQVVQAIQPSTPEVPGRVVTLHGAAAIAAAPMNSAQPHMAALL